MNTTAPSPNQKPEEGQKFSGGLRPFARTPVVGVDPTNDQPVIGFNVKGFFVFDAFTSSCGRFDVDPQETYGISVEDAKALRGMNAAIARATDAALDAGALEIQKELGVATGDLAGLFFSGLQIQEQIGQLMRGYLMAELAELAQLAKPTEQAHPGN